MIPFIKLHPNYKTKTKYPSNFSFTTSGFYADGSGFICPGFEISAVQTNRDEQFVCQVNSIKKKHTNFNSISFQKHCPSLSELPTEHAVNSWNYFLLKEIARVKTLLSLPDRTDSLQAAVLKSLFMLIRLDIGSL